MTKNTTQNSTSSSPSQDYSVRTYKARLGYDHFVPVKIRHYAWRTGSGVHSSFNWDHDDSHIPSWQMNRMIECGELTPTDDVVPAYAA